ncbi:hypothetical protein [Poseidonibacter lekithochrous]|uniref:hypothetical protein n=1 Tax=Poseidonibacter lekithochrous TaxID=1904463 RepID=UPI0008FCB1FC|nr:hypothetical protein [Poseidonibacter lekithochrous]QKJ22507.1 hypothetical protein ALEK_1228 [Poseidonibacter lekithochrous]
MKITNSVNKDANAIIDLKKKVLTTKKDEIPKKEEKTEIKDPRETIVVSVEQAKLKGIKQLIGGKTNKVLDELNKHKVSPKDLEDAIKKIKSLDTNKDGKVTVDEVKADLKKNENPKKVLSLVKNIIEEVKKDKDEVDINKFKNISKMINENIIGGKEGKSINKFLED